MEAVHGEALKAADLDGLFGVVMEDAGAFTENLDGTGAGATGAEDVGIEDGACGAFEIACGDLFNEAGDVNVGGAGGGAGGVEAKEAAVGFYGRGWGIEGRPDVLEARRDFGCLRRLLCKACTSGGRRWRCGRRLACSVCKVESYRLQRGTCSLFVC